MSEHIGYDDISLHLTDEDLPITDFSNLTDVDYDHVNTFIRIHFVLLARLGFVLIQLGTIPVENVYRITFYNILEIANGIMAYFLIGYMLSFGKSSANGWIGYSTAFSHQMDLAIFGICACLIGNAQISCFLIGRIHLAGSIIITIIYCGYYQPILMHWIWSENGWMNRAVFLEKRVSIKDFGGTLVIHLSSSLIGTIGSMFLGRRLIKVKDVDEHSLAREHSANTITGHVLILLGYLAFNLPLPYYETTRAPTNFIGIILLNNMVAFSTGLLVVCTLHLIIFRNIYNYWMIIRCFQGGIAGVISVSAAVDIYSQVQSMTIASIAALFYFFIAVLIHNTALEDYSNIISSHLISSFLGSLACPITAHKENFEKQYRSVHISWQLICITAVLCVTTLVALLLFLLLSLCKLLRNKHEHINHLRAKTLQRYLPRKKGLQRLFVIDSKTDHLVPGESKRLPYMQDEYTSTGDITKAG